MKTIVKHLRLLPAVIATAGMLLAVKSVGFAIEARADDTAAQTTAQTPETSAPATAQTDDPAQDDSETASAAEVDVLTSLSKRRAALDAREADLSTREALIDAAEKRVDGKIADLKTLQSQIQALLGQRDDAAQKQLDALVKTYSTMKPRDAARIFNALDENVELAVASQMKPDVLGAIMAAMSPDSAQKLTVKLADRLKLPAETASAAPAPAPAASPAPTQTAATPTAAAAPAASAPDAQAKPGG